MATTVIETIGFPSGFHNTIGDWELATRDAVGDDAVYIGELLNQEHLLTGSASVSFDSLNSNTDATRYRILRAADGAAYNPTTRDGARILVSWNNNSTDETKIRIDEDYFQLGGEQRGIGVIQKEQNSLSTAAWRVAVGMTDCESGLIESVYVELPYGSSAADDWILQGFHIGNGLKPCTVRNCTAVGAGVIDTAYVSGMNIGFWLFNIGVSVFAFGQNQVLSFCSVFGIQHTLRGSTPTSQVFNGMGFRVQGQKAKVLGCASVDNMQDWDDDPAGVTFAILGGTGGDDMPDAIAFPGEAEVRSLLMSTEELYTLPPSGSGISLAEQKGYQNILQPASADQVWVEADRSDFRNRGNSIAVGSSQIFSGSGLAYIPLYDSYGNDRVGELDIGAHQGVGAPNTAAGRIVERKVGTGQSVLGTLVAEHLQAVADGGASGLSKFVRGPGGDFVADGVAVGDSFKTESFPINAANNATWVVDSVTAREVIVVDAGDVVVDEDGFPGLLGTVANVNLAEIPVSVLNSGSVPGRVTFTRIDGSFVGDGFINGQFVYPFNLGISADNFFIVRIVTTKTLECDNFHSLTVPDKDTPNATSSATFGYEDLDAWETATEQNLINGPAPWGGTVQVAVLVDSDYTLTSTLFCRGAWTNDQFFRCIRADVDNRFLVGPKEGCQISSSLTRVMDISERNFRLGFDGVTHGAFAIENTNNANVALDNITVQASDVLIDGVWSAVRSGVHGSRYCFRAADGIDAGPLRPPAIGFEIRNSIAVGGGGAGPQEGFRSNLPSSVVRNNLAANIKVNAFATGFAIVGGSSRVTNCAAMECTDPFFLNFVPSGTVAFENNATDQAGVFVGLLSGQGNVNSIPASGYQSFLSEDYRLNATSGLLDAGQTLALEFQTSFAGLGRTSPWEIGPFSGFVPPPPYPFHQTQQTHRFARLWKIARRDGFVHGFIEAPMILDFEGEVFTATGGVDGSNVEETAGSQASDFELKGALIDGPIVQDTLQKGVLQVATVEMLYVDWKYPFSSGKRSRGIIEELQWDGTKWVATVGTLGKLLERKRGELATRTCRKKLYSQGTGNCCVDPTPFTHVSSVSDGNLQADERVQFATALANTQSDNYFNFGTFIWLTGDNAGQIQQTLSYADSSGTFTMVTKALNPIQNGDLFQAKAGCDHQFNGDCTQKFQNGINFNGMLWMPTNRRAFSQAGI